MPDLTIRKRLWEDLSAVAEKQNKRPEALAQQVLREYVQQFSDEDLLARSSTAARRAPFRMEGTEAVIRRHRRKKR